MTLHSIPVIAVDGPTASGKGTVAQRVAERLGFHYLDSGALYRLVALAALEAGIALNDAAALAALARRMHIAFRGERIELEGREVADRLRAEQVGNAASALAVFPQVRAALLDRQRNAREMPGLVADGRDIGTVIFPHAGLKVFLDAAVAMRAERRRKQLIEKGFPANISFLLKDLQDRDARDRSRPIAPLIPAQDAVIIDSTHMSVDAVVEQILGLAASRGLNQP